MESRRLQLNILDQSPAAPGEPPAAALQHTIELAQRAEEWGYHRFWVAEHHGSDRHMGSAPEVLMSHLLARTSRLRIGSGGVMLQHYSPYKVAENFNVLASLAPGRVDLGIGRGPGGMPKSTQALRPQPGPAAAGGPSLADKVVELRQFLHNQLDADHPLSGLQAMPRPPQPADLFLLGTTAASGEMAAQLGLPYVFAYFLNGDEREMRRAVDTYRQSFAAAGQAAPPVMLALPVIVAEEEKSAAAWAAEVRAVRITLESGRTFTVFSETAAQEFGRQSGEKFRYAVQPSRVIHGKPAAVAARLSALAREYGVAEVFAVTAIPDFAQRLRSYQLLRAAMVEYQSAHPEPVAGSS